MKTVIYYFSGTGNNLAIAKQLASLLGDTDLFPMHQLLKNKVIPAQYEWVGFTSPAYFSHVPPFVEHCMKDLIFTPSQKIFTIVGSGINPGIAHLDMRKQIEACSKKSAIRIYDSLPW